MWLPLLGSNLLLLPVGDFNILQCTISRLHWFLRYYLKSELSNNGCLMFITSESISDHIPLAYGTPDIHWTLTQCSTRHCTFSLDCHVWFSSISLKVSIIMFIVHVEKKQKEANNFQRWAGLELRTLELELTREHCGMRFHKHFPCICFLLSRQRDKVKLHFMWKYWTQHGSATISNSVLN